MNEEHENRRAGDNIILEMHGMLAGLIQRMDDHIKVDEVAHKKIEDVEIRLRPMEDWHDSMKTVGKGLAIAGTPILLGTGVAIWSWVKTIIAHTKVTP